MYAEKTKKKLERKDKLKIPGCKEDESKVQDEVYDVWWSGNYNFQSKTSSTLTGPDCRLTEGVPRFRVQIYLCSFTSPCVPVGWAVTLFQVDSDQQRVRNWSSTTRKILHAVGIMFFDRAEFVTRSVSLLMADFVSRRDLLAIALSPKSSDHLSRLVDLLIT